jgi:hypothetical protein
MAGVLIGQVLLALLPCFGCFGHRRVLRLPISAPFLGRPADEFGTPVAI